MAFNVNEITAEEITENNEYHGVRVRLKAMLGTASQVLQIDIGFGDVIHQGPINITYPVLLDFPAPKIKAYSMESAIAEKFEAIVSIGLATSRMKDFYDILFFANSLKFNSSSLSEAIKITFKNRNTDLSFRDNIYEKYFRTNDQKQIQWTAFLLKNKLDAHKRFEEVISKIEIFIEPLFELNKSKTWNPEKWKWE